MSAPGDRMPRPGGGDPGAPERPGAVPKRSAFEPPATLIEPPASPEPLRRPAATAFGSAVVTARALAGIASLVALWLGWDTIAPRELDLGAVPGVDAAAVSRIVLAVLLVGGGLLSVVQLVLAVFIWFGGNRARITVMLMATVSIASAWVDSVAGSVEITLRTTFITLALDILVLLALSSRDARVYARRSRG